MTTIVSDLTLQLPVYVYPCLWSHDFTSERAKMFGLCVLASRLGLADSGCAVGFGMSEKIMTNGSLERCPRCCGSIAEEFPPEVCIGGNIRNELARTAY